MGKTVLLLINIGSPKSPSVRDVRRYLQKFLNDPRVMTLSSFARFFLVNGIILPFRSPKSAKTYEKVWTEQGSPLLVHSDCFAKKLQEELGSDIEVCNAMMYGEPFLSDVLSQYKEKLEKLIVLPMYPQYASSTTGAALEAVFRSLAKWNSVPVLETIAPFYSQHMYISSMVSQLVKFDLDRYDHLLFSYHGLPLSHIQSAHPNGQICSNNEDLQSSSHSEASFCYRAQCLETTKGILRELDLPEKLVVSNSFQSRLSKDWMEPFTDKTLEHLAKEGVKKVLIVCPSFVVDCLETLYEISQENREVFIEAGGEDLTLVPALNSNSDWVHAVATMVRRSV